MLLEKYNIPDSEKVISQKDMAQLLGISVRTLSRWDKSGKFIARRKPNGHPYYLIKDYEQYHIDAKIRGENYNV